MELIEGLNENFDYTKLTVITKEQRNLA